MNFITYDKLYRDVLELSAKLPHFDAVYGIPRSGMVPAAMFAAIRNIPLGVKGGVTTLVDSGKRGGEYVEIRTVLVLDDSAQSGRAIKDAKKRNLTYKTKYAAVYASEGAKVHLDYWGKSIPKRVFQWNFMSSRAVGKACVDIDGVLAVETTKEDLKNRDALVNFYKNTKPLLKTKYKIHSIVTGRLEQDRELTEAWLEKWGIEYDNLYMRPSKDVRPSVFKAEIFKSSPTQLFIESNPKQSRYIHENTGKPVICVDEMKGYGC